MKKRIATILLTLSLMVTTLGGLVSCGGENGGKTDDNQLTLEIGVTDFGYGTAWVQRLADVFVEEDWVKAKYPGLKVEVKPNYTRSEPSNKIDGIESNTIDLFIGASDWSKFNKTDRLNGETIRLYEDLSDIMDMTVPGESVKVSEKLRTGVEDQFKYYEATGSKTDANGKYSIYSFPTVAGVTGIVYNEKILSDIGIDVPLTTNQLSDVCDAIVAANLTAPTGNKVVPFMFTTKINYWTCMAFYRWWAQYEGVENYNNFYEGLYLDEDGLLSQGEGVFKQQGRLESLEVIEDLLAYRDGNRSPNVSDTVNTLEFVQAQIRFAAGEGVFQLNGDWFENETETENKGKTKLYFDQLSMMRYPVISSIVERLEDNAMTDETLAKVVAAVDAGATSYEGVSANDFARISEARNINPINIDNVAMIPSYATAKDVAKDFLLFAATEKAAVAIANGTGNFTSSFYYDFEEKSPEMYASFSNMRKEIINIFETSVALPLADTHKLVYLGGLKPLTDNRQKVELLFTSQNAKDRMTAQQIYETEISKWTTEKFNNILTNAGMN